MAITSVKAKKRNVCYMWAFNNAIHMIPCAYRVPNIAELEVDLEFLD